MSDDLSCYTAVEALTAIKSGAISSEALLQSCLDRYDKRENLVKAWEFLDKDLALQKARKSDEKKRYGRLQGVPIGIKDIIQTDDMPCSYGSRIFDGHRAQSNATCIDRLQQAGAVIMGKTVTTEFAYLNPGVTRNPHNPDYSPGGSSSGSAAAVADRHVPLALGTQTAGSIIRPASYCGVVGYKPSFNSYPVAGIHPFAPSLDTLGGFARSVADIVLLHNVLADVDLKPGSKQPSKIALLKGPYWQEAEKETGLMFEQLEEIFRQNKITLDELQLPDEFMGINDAQKKIQLKECTQSLNEYYENSRAALSEKLLADYEYGLSLDEELMTAAYALVAQCKALIANIFSDYQLILTAASPGRAPRGLEITGDPVFNRMWTALGVPCISLPFPQAEDGLPLGIQLVGALNKDADLLEYASWLEALLKNSTS